ncbi:hypothetical protein Adt_46193 [Abeliophyllum distichum]|uniref:Uncharacterized protein n=1 Tax=Abeliophyllum distichum TaxID=126358 RepID=A0ABD1P3X7_9LAMI
MDYSFDQVPLPLRLGHLAACSVHGPQLRSSASPTETRPPSSLLLHGAQLRSRPLLLGLGHLVACSSYRTQFRSSTSPTGTRPSSSLLLPWSIASLKDLFHWDSAT